MLRYAHTISSSSRRLASRHPMFCDSCTAGPRQFYPLRNSDFQLADNATRFVAGSFGNTKAYMRTNNTNGEMFQFVLSESGSLFSGYYGKYGDSGKTLWAGATKSDLSNALQSVAGPQGDRLSLIKVIDSDTSNPYIAVYLNGSSDRYGYIPITKD